MKRLVESLVKPFINESKKRVPRKKGQHRGSKSHSDLYTDENPKGTIKGLKFATVKDAEASVRKIKSSGRSHAHKIQAAVAMEQRAREMGKKSQAAVYRSYINKMKKKTKKMQKEDAEDDELARDMAAAQRKMQGAREKKRLKVRHKTQMDRLKTATPDEKKDLKTRQDAESKANAIAIKRDIENIRRTEGLWDNIRKKRERIKRGSGERMRKPGDKGAPTPSQIQRAKGD